MWRLHLDRLVDRLGYAATARRLHVHEKTVKRWHTEKTQPYSHIARLIELEAREAFGTLPAPWDNWRVAADGRLYEDGGERRGYTPGDVRALFHLEHALRDAHRTLEQLRGEVAALQDQPRTVNVPDISKLARLR